MSLVGWTSSSEYIWQVFAEETNLPRDCSGGVGQQYLWMGSSYGMIQIVNKRAVSVSLEELAATHFLWIRCSPAAKENLCEKNKAKSNCDLICCNNSLFLKLLKHVCRNLCPFSQQMCTSVAGQVAKGGQKRLKD